MTNTVLDSVHRNQPLYWWQRRKPISALQIASASLEDCRRDQLDHADKAEYHAAMHKMLKDRESRLMKEINRLSSDAAQPSQP